MAKNGPNDPRMPYGVWLAISGPGDSKWLKWLDQQPDLGGTHPGWSVGDIWTHRNCHRGALGGQNWPEKAINQVFLAI